MDQLLQWIGRIDEAIAELPVPIGEWAKSAVEWLTDNFEWVFDGITNGLKYPIEGTADLLKSVPAVVLIIAIATLAHLLQRKWTVAAFVGLGLLFILNPAALDEIRSRRWSWSSMRPSSRSLIGIPGRHLCGAAAVALPGHRAGPGHDADPPDLRVSDADAGPVRPRHRCRA